MNPVWFTQNARLIGWLICALIVAYMVFVVMGWKFRAEQLSTVEATLSDYKRDVEQGNAKVEKLEQELRNERSLTQQWMEKWENESEKNPIYRTCLFSNDSVRIINEAAAASRAP